ncbi:GMC family oxidoreductase [Nakamurella sp.]|uniref:GMC family oxidoreductase n=1 Tax=Nakamurella sp. TaxID=1869182 RepID=UPI003B3AA4C4
MAFDYVIVGAGSAGVVLANRLSADPGCRVLLLEAGPADRHPAIRVPAAFSTLFRSRYDWGYDTVPQPELAGRRIFWPRGRTLGGSSSLNAMMWVSGFAADYDGWADEAGPLWSWAAVLPSLRRAEEMLHREPQRSPNPHTADFLTAAAQAGFPIEPATRPAPAGFSATVVTQRRGARFSAADGYLRPARRRPNLTVRTGVQARRVLFDGRRATAVECSTGDGRVRTVSARREILLCGGAVNTPQLLLLSGIGDPDELAAHGVPLLVARPAVGRNLQDHLVAGLIVRTTGGTLLDAQRPAEVARYLLRRTGMLTSNVAEAYGFIRTDPGLAHADVEVVFAPVAYVGQGLERPPAHGLTVGAILLQPQSRGTVRLCSADPLAPPVIDPAYLSDPRDRATMLRGLAACERILRSPALRHQGFLVPAGDDGMDEATRDRTALEGFAHTLYHPVGTARMGTDEASVVDPRLRVRGVTGLRVVDASVMPRIIRGHTHAPAVVIGERAAELIRS